LTIKIAMLRIEQVHEKVKFGSVALCHGAPLVVTHDKSTLRELAHICTKLFICTMCWLAWHDVGTSAFKVHSELSELTYRVLDEADPTFHRVKLSV
ncbi:hypothetical protein, partial [Vibrio parahaemolyticus]|uniref:hypothetical protein n=1 Tax=Vibrio parahaemolyticus TaxID=670 RepID=UPI0021534C72